MANFMWKTTVSSLCAWRQERIQNKKTTTTTAAAAATTTTTTTTTTHTHTDIHTQWHAHTSLRSSTHTTINKILMISNNDTNLNLSFHPPNPCLLLLPRSLMLFPSLPPFPPPSPYPYASIYIQLPHTNTPFFRFYRKALANIHFLFFIF